MATDLWFQVAPDGNRVLVFEHPGGRQLLNLRETEERVREAEEKVRHEAQARQAAEAELARLQTELARLRGNP